MASSLDSRAKKSLKSLCDEFQRAYDLKPNFGHMFIRWNVAKALQSGIGGNTLLGLLPRIIVPLLSHGRHVVRVVPPLSSSGDFSGISAYCDSSTETDGVQQFGELALSACRIIDSEAVSVQASYGAHVWGWPTSWVSKIYKYAASGGDPRLNFRHHQLRVHNDKEFKLDPGYGMPIPEGRVEQGFMGSKPWIEIFKACANAGLEVRVLERGLFRASAILIDAILDGATNINAAPIPVVLLGPNEPPEVLGNRKPVLKHTQYRAIERLLQEYPKGITKDELESDGLGNARQVLTELREADHDWRTVIVFPGKKAAGGYRLQFPPT